MNAESTSTVLLDQQSQQRLKDLHVVFLVNFVAPNLIAVMQQLAKRVGRLTILSSVAMEANRDWQSEWKDLNVIVQKTWTITRTPKHPSGYREVNYIHVPLDTLRQLKRLDPDVVVSLEMGARSFFSSLYCRLLRKQTAHVLSVYASERSEAGRGRIRWWLRRRLLRGADWVTFNGPSCRRLLIAYGGNPEKMSPWDYAADPRKTSTADGKRVRCVPTRTVKLLTVGQLSERKGVSSALQQLANWASANPTRKIQWDLVGQGPLQEQIDQFPCPANLQFIQHGHLDPAEIAQHYAGSDLLLFPTLADEWGLVVDEAMTYGLPVVGSCHSQAVETLIEDDVTGWSYDPESNLALAKTLDHCLTFSSEQWQSISVAASEVARRRTPDRSADQLASATLHAMDSPPAHSTTASRQEVLV